MKTVGQKWEARWEGGNQATDIVELPGLTYQDESLHMFRLSPESFFLVLSKPLCLFLLFEEILFSPKRCWCEMPDCLRVYL